MSRAWTAPVSAHGRDDPRNDALLAIGILVIVSVIISVVSAGIALSMSSVLRPAVDRQVRQEVVKLDCNLTGTVQHAETVISCKPQGGQR